MGGKRMAGHGRIAILGEDGWDIKCKCGWTALAPLATRLPAYMAYREHLLASMPLCAGCGQLVPKSRVSKFRSSHCKSCAYKAARAWKAANPNAWERSARKSHLKKQYGITPEIYDAMLCNQSGLCAICKDQLKDSRGFRPHIDHCHATGKVRGLLCYACNSGLGHFRDSVTILTDAISYLKRN